MTVETAENYVLQLLPKLGVNKRRELVRLVYEIAKRDGAAPQDILPAQKNLNFESAKKQLLAQRYPVNFKTAAKDRFYLPKLELDPALRADLTPRAFYPKTVYIETSVQDSGTRRARAGGFPKSRFPGNRRKDPSRQSEFFSPAGYAFNSPRKIRFFKTLPLQLRFGRVRV